MDSGKTRISIPVLGYLLLLLFALIPIQSSSNSTTPEYIRVVNEPSIFGLIPEDMGKPSLVFSGYGYNVNLYYYDPSSGVPYSLKQHNPFGVFFSLSKICSQPNRDNESAGIPFDVYLSLYNLTRDWGIAPFPCQSTSAIIVGVPGDPQLFLLSIIEVLEPLEQEILEHGVTVEVYKLDYNCSTVAEMLAKGYASRLNSTLGSRGMSIFPYIGVRLTPFYCRPFLLINTTLYEEIIKAKPEERIVLLEKAGSIIASSLAESSFPFKTVDVEIFMGYIKKTPTPINLVTEAPEHTEGSSIAHPAIPSYTSEAGNAEKTLNGALSEGLNTPKPPEKPGTSSLQEPAESQEDKVRAIDGFYNGISTTSSTTYSIESPEDLVKIVYAVLTGLAVVGAFFALNRVVGR